MSEKRGRGQPKFEPTQDQRSQVKLMKALGIPEDRICKTITNPRTRKPVAPMTLARAFAAELASGATEVHALVGNFILCAILGKKPALGDAIKSEQVRMTAAIFYAKTKMGWKETVVNEPANKDDRPARPDPRRCRSPLGLRPGGQRNTGGSSACALPCRGVALYRGGGVDPDAGPSRMAGQRGARRGRRDPAARLAQPVDPGIRRRAIGPQRRDRRRRCHLPARPGGDPEFVGQMIDAG